MKHFYALMLMLVVCGHSQLLAQTPDQIGALLDLLGQEGQNTFTNQLDGLNDSLFNDRFDGLRFTDLDLGGAQDSLFHHLGQGNFPDADSMSLFWDYNQGELENFLNNDTLSPADSSTLITSFFGLNEDWYSNYDSLNANGSTVDGFTDGILQGDVTDGDVRWEQFQGPWHQIYRDLLNDELTPAVIATDYQDEEDLQDIANGTIFSSMFDFEIAYGQAWNDVNFYTEAYRTTSNVIRIASVPTYKQPLELRWALEGSFFLETQNTGNDAGISLLEGLNPLHYNGNIALAYMPRFGSLGNLGSFHLYASVGMDVGTYVPAHANNSSLRAASRVGKTTGFGPQVGAGFVINYGDISTYSYGTIATGAVVDDFGLGYQYDAATLNAGIRFGNVVNVMYTSGTSSWAPKEGKRHRFGRFTVGLILDALLPSGN